MTFKIALRMLSLISISIVASGQEADLSSVVRNEPVGDDSPLVAFENIFIEPGDSGGDGNMFLSRETDIFDVTSLSFKATNSTLKDLISFVYRMDDFRISGGPDWAYSASYNIDAHAPILDPDIHVNRSEREMLRGMLLDLFGLNLEVDSKRHFIIEVDELTGPKFQESEGDSGEQPRISYDRQGKIVGRVSTMSALAEFIGEYEDVLVLDQTGLMGEYDFTLSWGRDRTSYIFKTDREDTLREEMGLRMRYPRVQHLVIDSARQPVSN